MVQIYVNDISETNVQLNSSLDDTVEEFIDLDSSMCSSSPDNNYNVDFENVDETTGIEKKLDKHD